MVVRRTPTGRRHPRNRRITANRQIRRPAIPDYSGLTALQQAAVLAQADACDRRGIAPWLEAVAVIRRHQELPDGALYHVMAHAELTGFIPVPCLPEYAVWTSTVYLVADRGSPVQVCYAECERYLRPCPADDARAVANPYAALAQGIAHARALGFYPVPWKEALHAKLAEQKNR